MSALLEVENLSVYYGVIQALKGISFHVDKGEVVALIGANGAGKTTTLHTLRLRTKGEQSDKQQQYAHNHLQRISFYSSLAAIRHAFTMNNKGRKHTLPLRRIRFLQPANKIVQR